MTRVGSYAQSACHIEPTHAPCMATHVFAFVVAVLCMVQLLRFIVEGDLINVMHRGINTDNMYVRNANRLETAELAMGGFGRLEHGRVHVRKAPIVYYEWMKWSV